MMACFKKSYDTIFSVMKYSRTALARTQSVKLGSSPLHNRLSSFSKNHLTTLRQSPVCSKLLSRSSAETVRYVHAKSENDQQFDEFLTSEIAAEKKEAPSELLGVTDFKVSTDGPNVKLTKSHGDETITVEFNINNSVTSEDGDEDDEGDNAEPSEMTSQPDFTVTIQKKDSASKMCLRCQLMDPTANDGVPKDEADSFFLSEMAMVEGEWDDKTYTVNADLLDPNMYDMLMLMLDDRGITHDAFCEQLVEYSTQYEHNKYINMLESLQSFLKK